ncbi:MAG: GNAT family N-acetyltransferase [Promethearchaeota archaeon]|nr:MAG: GNAT family N-acetyltransferase [Candidatus Lokiarchaeota archaeon]
MELKKGYERKINKNFTIYIAKDNKEELNEILDFNVKIHGPPVKEYLSRILLKHPRIEELLFLYIRDNFSNDIVSGIALFPLDWHFDDLLIPVCEMGFVGTLPEYRGKKLMAHLFETYEKAMRERGIILSVIRGIPYFYRKYNYEFALPLDNRIYLSPTQVPTEDVSDLTIRRANEGDIELISRLYHDYYDDFFIRNKLSTEEFKFRYFNEDYNDFKLVTYMIEKNGEAETYFSFGMSHDNLAYSLIVPRLTVKHMIKILQFIKEIDNSNNSEMLYLHLREDIDFGKFVMSLGGNPYQDYGWQVKIPNLKPFFQSIKTILEHRIKKSIYKGLTKSVRISNYQETIELFFKNGEISEIKTEKGYPAERSCDLQVPGPMIYKLLLADKNFDEINHIVKDAMVKLPSKQLVNILFPKKTSYPDTYY